MNTQDTENCEAASDVCYLSSVKAYILVALSFTRQVLSRNSMVARIEDVGVGVGDGGAVTVTTAAAL